MLFLVHEHILLYIYIMCYTARTILSTCTCTGESWKGEREKEVILLDTAHILLVDRGVAIRVEGGLILYNTRCSIARDKKCRAHKTRD